MGSLKGNERVLRVTCKSHPSETSLRPKTYAPPPVLFPFSARSCGILGASTVHRIAGNGEILSRIVPDECCWFSGQARCGGPRVANNFLKCTAFVDCSHPARDKEWFSRNGSVLHPSTVQAILRQRENYESFGNGGSDENYIIINTGRSNNDDDPIEDELGNETKKQMNQKLEDEDSSKHLNVFSTKQDDNI